MIREYKKQNVIDTFGDNGLIYEASKNAKKYYLYEFEQYGEADVYNFKVLKKIMSTHILAVCQQFVEDGVQYIITDAAEKDLLKLQTDQPNSVFPLPVALDYFSKIILALEEFHQCKLVYRNLRAQVIKLKGDDIYFYDFTLSQFCKRKQRMFDVVGCQSFLAPQFFSQDGYSFEIDIWAAGVLLFFMLTHQYPFKFKDKSQKATQQQFKQLAQYDFSFQKRLQSCKNPGFIKSNKILEDFFKKIFDYDYQNRITIKKIKQHKLMTGYFPERMDLDILEAIGQQGSIIQSVFLTKFIDLKQYKFSTQIQKQQLILDFVERCSESLMLDCAEYIPENIRNRAQFAILKVAMTKINYLVDLCYGKRKPDFSLDQQEFQVIKNNSAFKKVLQNLERKQKIISMLYRASFMQLQKVQQDSFYSEQVPQDFNEIKISYRLALSEMFESVKNVMQKNKGNKLLLRKLTQVMVRMVIMHLINRIFQPQDFNKNFSLYIAWNKSEAIDRLDQWIHAEKQINLKHFIKQTTKNYL